MAIATCSKINRSLHPQVLQVVIYKLWDERQEILPTTKRLVYSWLRARFSQVFRKVMRTSIGASFMQEKFLGAPRESASFLVRALGAAKKKFAVETQTYKCFFFS